MLYKGLSIGFPGIAVNNLPVLSMGKKMRRTLSVIIAVAIAVVLIFLNKPAPQPKQKFGWKIPNQFMGLLAYSKLRPQGLAPQGLPVRLKISTINVNAAVEDAIIEDGRMDVPAGGVNVAWFSLGAKPGEVGTAVIGGHYGLKTGPSVFDNLHTLVPGDIVEVVNDRGETITFIVRDIRIYKADTSPTEVFTSQDGGAHLNLITCEGIWNAANGMYQSRRVVFTDRIDASTVTNSTTNQNQVFMRDLTVGYQGVDVIALQQFLIERGFLARVSPTGYFGSLTKAALSKWQRSSGIRPAIGYFGRISRSKLAGATITTHTPVIPTKFPIVGSE